MINIRYTFTVKHFSLGFHFQHDAFTFVWILGSFYNRAEFESNITTELCFVCTFHLHALFSYTRQIPFHLNSSVNSYLFCLRSYA